MLTMENFSEWLWGKLEERNWQAADLARVANISKSSLSNILNNNRSPGPDVCNAVAQALGIPPEEVFREAGLLPPLPTGDKSAVQELLELVKNMPSEDQQEILDYARYRYQKRKSSVKPRPKRQDSL